MTHTTPYRVLPHTHRRIVRAGGCVEHGRVVQLPEHTRYTEVKNEKGRLEMWMEWPAWGGCIRTYVRRESETSNMLVLDSYYQLSDWRRRRIHPLTKHGKRVLPVNTK